MLTQLFDYDLPPELIAQSSVEPRDASRLMLIDRVTGAWKHKQFFEIVDELRAGDVLVFNDTKVFRARLYGKVRDRFLEVFLLRSRIPCIWEVLIRPGRSVHIGDCLVLGSVGHLDHVTCEAEVIGKHTDGIVELQFSMSTEQVVAFANRVGDIPIPPYVTEQPTQLDQYQTVYARRTGSVAAPTAGFHFTKTLLQTIKDLGVHFEFITLHVGIGTFRPMKSQTVEAHDMHSEFVSIDASVAQRILQAKQEGRRVIAVGTTTVRTLEGVAQMSGLRGYAGDVNLFIQPGFSFQIIDGLVTNFHLPRSTLLVLISAFAGREHLLAAYAEAITERYRFFSFGDAMFISGISGKV